MSKAEKIEPKFKAGKFATSIGVHGKMQENLTFDNFIKISLGKHLSGDWGEVHEDDEGLNDEALETGARLLSVYKFRADTDEEEKIWIITEASREATTIIFPHEY